MLKLALNNFDSWPLPNHSFRSCAPNVPHIFAIGDIVGQPMLAHKAVLEAHVASEVIAGKMQDNKELAAAAFNAESSSASPTPTPNSPGWA